MGEGAGSKESIEDRCEVIRDTIDASTSEYEKDKMKERLAKLSGGVAVINVGGASEVEVNEVKDRLNDALCATRAALEEGIVPGGGTALLYASRKLNDLKLNNLDQQVGVDAIKAALKQPCIQIAQNAGAEGAVVVKTLDSEANLSMGFNAASVASLMTTTECIIAEEVEDVAPEQVGVKRKLSPYELAGQKQDLPFGAA